MPSNRVYPVEWQAIRRDALLRANYRCEWCGMLFGGDRKALDPAAVNKKGLPLIITIHHIDDDAMNNTPKNLVALCQRCHLMAEPWKPGRVIPGHWGGVPGWIIDRGLKYQVQKEMGA